MLDDLVELVKKVQQYRFKAASKKHERKLPKIKPEYDGRAPGSDGSDTVSATLSCFVVLALGVLCSRKFAWLGKQMGIAAEVVSAEFAKRQAKANEVLKANYRKRMTRPVHP